MKHPPFDSWLFDQESLTADEGEAFQQHLAECEECRALAEAWQAVDARMLVAGSMAPEPGFVGRWQLRLAQARAKRKRRQTSLVLAATATGALLLAPFFGLLLWSVLSSPTDLAWGGLEQLQALSVGVEALRGFLTVVVRALQDVNALWWVALLLGATWISGLWAGLLYRIAFKTIPNGVSK
jgi:anti-sigma factor RsiW